MYHGVHSTADGPIYRVGLALLDLDDPTTVLHRTDRWVFGPEAPYEITGDVGRVVFPCGWIHDAETDRLHLYYGAADSVIGARDGRVQRGDRPGHGCAGRLTIRSVAGPARGTGLAGRTKAGAR